MKWINDSIRDLVNYNSSNGYSSVGQWAMTSGRKEVYIQEINDGKFTGVDRNGDVVEGSTEDIVRTITRKDLVKEYLQGMSQVGYGSEGEVFTDGQYAYKVVSSDLVPDIEEIKKYVDKDYPNVVKIYDAWEMDGGYYTVIKMELLDELPVERVDQDEYERVRDELWETQDNVNYIKGIKTTDEEIQRMLDAIINAAKYVGYLDVGFHNLMYDKKTDQYKQIDIF